MLSERESLLFYIAAFAISSAMLVFVAKNEKKKTMFYYIMVFCAFGIPIAIAGFRTCGTDTLTYIQTYLRTAKLPWDDVYEDIDTYFEAGHKLLTRFLGIFKSVRLYLAVYAAVTLIFVYKTTRYLKNEAIALPMFIFFMLFYSSAFNGMRQYLAASIIVLSYKFVFEKDFKKFIICIALAAAFHTSSLIMVFVYFLWTKKDKLASWQFLMIILVIVTVVSIGLESILNRLGEYDFESSSLQRYVNYNTDEFDTKNRDFYLRLVITFACLFYYKPLVEYDKRNSFFIFLMIIGAVLGICGFLNPTTKRIALYFNIVNIWVLADIPKVFKDHHSVWSARIIIAAYVVIRFWLVYYILEQSHLIPYIWYLPGWVTNYFG